MAVATRQPLTAAVLTALATLGYPVGDGRPPTRTAPQVADGRYLVCWSLAGGEVTYDDLAGHHDTATVVYQVDATGKTRAQAEWLGDAVRTLLLGRTAEGPYVTALTVTGWTVFSRDLDAQGGVDYEADDVHTDRTRYSLRVLPG